MVPSAVLGVSILNWPLLIWSETVPEESSLSFPATIVFVLLVLTVSLAV